MTKLSENAIEVIKKRYFDTDEKSWEELANRVSAAVSINEKDKKWEVIFAEEIHEMNFIPGGRILRNSGKLKQSVLNCAALPIGDSIESIGETIKNSLILWSYGAGIGIDFSPLRYKGSPLISKGGKSSGLVSFLEAMDAVARTIETGGQRRSGCLAMCNVWHPEIFDFIDAKVEDKKLAYFNLSVAVDNNFLDSVEENKDWELKFSGKTIRVVKARGLWNKILKSMIESGEPGLINIDNLRKNNSFYFQPISTTNLCGELPLSEYGMCCLGSLVLPSFLSGTQTNWKKLNNSIYSAVRFLDNVLDVNYYPIKQTEIVTLDSRRIGLGVMGLHDYLLKKKISYGSERSLLEIDRLFKFIRDAAYRASIDLSKEKGTFPKYIKSEYNSASFIKKLPAKIRIDLKEYGIRNTCLLSTQPTGTTSLIPEVSSGIEPIFSLATERSDRISNRYYIHPELVKVLESNEDIPEWLIDSSSLSPEDHLEVQSVIQRYVDNAVSKTINCPKGFTAKKLSKLLLEFVRDVKGMTVYVDESKEGQVLNKLSMKEAKKIVEKNLELHISEKNVECMRGECGL
ncbi:hypothetical protein LCGC14_0986980 [marine sediment metagenome]|uniref:ribonucleoside-diphosphate reductase n=1 Tax=marine sediment metagenome TaxID=412755 RepID=A0A0F9NTH3_9ZZZZ|nr:hypothetical protein [Candidatus Aminicenantes bacterium]